MHKKISDLQALLRSATAENSRQKFEEAGRLCDLALREHPENVDLTSLRGIIAFQLGNGDEAESWFEKALLMEPQSSAIAFNYAMTLLSRKKPFAALTMLKHVVNFEPDHAQAHWHIGNILRKTGNPAEALAAFQRARQINPFAIEDLEKMGKQLGDDLNNKGLLLERMGRLQEARQNFEQALCLDPDDCGFLNNLGVIHYQNNRPDTAEALYRAALSLNPQSPEALNNLSTISLMKGDTTEAVAYCRKALSVRPSFSDALNNLGNALKAGHKYHEALEAYESAIRIAPDNAEIHMNLAGMLLSLGRFEEGWREFAWRRKLTYPLEAGQRFSQPQWRGRAAKERTLLIHAEQGLGDSLQFCRYASLARERGLRVLMEAPAQLKRILQSVDGVEAVYLSGENLPSFDLHCPMMSLPQIMRTTLGTIPAKLPYLSADPSDVAAWRERMQASGDKTFTVGLTWAGSPRSNSPDDIAMDKQRSIDPALLASLMDIPRVRFFSLQKAGAPAPRSFPITGWMDDCQDLADTAALIMNLDLVISVDTAVAHLAGALGKPVWLLNRYDGCWRWLPDRTDSPWYPEVMRIFHQTHFADWSSVIARVTDELRQLAAGKTNDA